MSRSVVISGAALATPAGYSLAENYSAAFCGKTCFTKIDSFNTTGSSIKFAGQCADPPVRNLPDRKVKKVLRRKDIISLLTVLEAAKDAGLSRSVTDPERIGMYVGAGSTQVGDLTPYFTLVADCADLSAGRFDSEAFGQNMMNLVNPLVVLQTLMNNSLCFGTMCLDIRGVNANYMDFQLAGLRAVGEAYRSIIWDKADVVIAGGVAGPIEPFQLAEGVKGGFLARTGHYDELPSDLVRPYDARRQGAVLSEGAAYVVLEEEDHALARGASVLGRVTGFGCANDGNFDFLAETNSLGLVRAMEIATDEAGLKKEKVGFVAGYGNGARSSDGAEAKSYVRFFNGLPAAVPITSVKSVLGDMCEAGGVVSLVLALESLKRRAVAPTLNFSQGDRSTEQLSIAAEPQAIHSPTALVTTRNFLGSSGCLAIEGP